MDSMNSPGQLSETQSENETETEFGSDDSKENVSVVVMRGIFGDYCINIWCRVCVKMF